MKKLFYNLLMLFSVALFIVGGLLGCFAGMGICAVIWGEGIIRTALGSPPDHFHPSFWLWFAISIFGMAIGFAGGLSVGRLVRMYAAWIAGEKAKPNLLDWLKSLAETS